MCDVCMLAVDVGLGPANDGQFSVRFSPQTCTSLLQPSLGVKCRGANSISALFSEPVYTVCPSPWEVGNHIVVSSSALQCPAVGGAGMWAWLLLTGE